MYSRGRVGLLGIGLSGLLRTLLHRVRLQAERAVVSGIGVVVSSVIVSSIVSSTVSTSLLTLCQSGAERRVNVHKGDGGVGDDSHAGEGGDELLNLHLVDNSEGVVDQGDLNKIL